MPILIHPPTPWLDGGTDTPSVPWLRTRLGNFTVPAVLAYLVATTLFLIWRGISVSPDYFVFLLLFGAIILGRWRAFLVDWMPFIALLLGYEFLRGLAGSSGIPVHYVEVIRADRALGLGQLPGIWLQQHLHRQSTISALDYAATMFYFLHFAYPLTLGYWFWLRDRPNFRHYAAALLLMSFACFVFFLLVPVAPPWLASQRGYLPHVDKIISSTIPSQTTWFYQHLNPNPVAAFPSLHEAFPVLGLLYGIRTFGARAWPLGLWCLAVGFSIVYLGEHYLIDAIAGVAVAALAYAAVEFATARIPYPPRPRVRDRLPVGAVDQCRRRRQPSTRRPHDRAGEVVQTLLCHPGARVVWSRRCTPSTARAGDRARGVTVLRVGAGDQSGDRSLVVAATAIRRPPARGADPVGARRGLFVP